jgi:hypothetical protein
LIRHRARIARTLPQTLGHRALANLVRRNVVRGHAFASASEVAIVLPNIDGKLPMFYLAGPKQVADVAFKLIDVLYRLIAHRRDAV